MVVDTIPASARRGLNRVIWSMRLKPPDVPPAASVAFAGFNGPRVLPGRYTVRLTKGTEHYEQSVDVGLDRRATFTQADRRAQFEAAMRVHSLFGRMSALVRRVNTVRDAADHEAAALPSTDPARAPVAALATRADEVRKKIVATTEGGAITGEERLREHADALYGALLSYEGAPAAYQLERIVALTAELTDVEAEFDGVLRKELPAANAALKRRKRPAIAEPAATATANAGSGGDPAGLIRSALAR